MNETDALYESAERGMAARNLLADPLLVKMLADMAEQTTVALLGLPVSAHEDRFALCTALRVLRGMPAELQRVADGGEFDARRLAQLTKDRADA